MNITQEQYDGVDPCEECAFNANSHSCITVMKTLAEKGFKPCCNTDNDEQYVYKINP